MQEVHVEVSWMPQCPFVYEHHVLYSSTQMCISMEKMVKTEKSFQPKHAHVLQGVVHT